MWKATQPILKTGLWILMILVLITAQFSSAGASKAAALQRQGSQDYNDPPPKGEAGEPGTPMQESLKKAIDERIALGQPAPSSVSFESEVTTGAGVVGFRSMAGASTKTVVTITSSTELHFDNPQQAGYEKWPDLTVEGDVPEGATGSIQPGNYNQLVRDELEALRPGFWDEYEFGYEPRTYRFQETITRSYSAEDLQLIQQLASAAGDSTAVEDILLGFTYTGPNLDYTVDYCVEILPDVCAASFLAGFKFDYGLGLRLPMQASLTSPDLMPEGSNFSPTSSLIGQDWDAAAYTAAGLAAEDGNEFVMRLTFICGIFLEIAGQSVIDLGVNVDEDESASFATPFGPGEYFPLPGLDVPLWSKSAAGLASVELGFSMTPKLGSDRVTADWTATGDYVDAGQLTYTAASLPVSFGPLNTIDGPAQTDVKIDGFRYYFTQFLLEMSAYIKLDVIGIWDGTFSIPITDFDLSALTGDLYLGVHEGTTGSISKTTYIENVPPTAQIDRTGTISLGGVQTFMSHVGSLLTVTGYATDPGKDDLTLEWDWDDGPPSPDASSLYPVPYSVTESRSHSFASGCLYHVRFAATDDDGGSAYDEVPVLITAVGSQVRREGYWQAQYSGNGASKLGSTALNCYLAIAGHLSSVFSEVQDASSPGTAYDVLFMQNHLGDPIDQFDRELLVVWLNLASGALDYDDMLDMNGDGVGDAHLHDVVLAAEQVRLDPDATAKQIRNETQLLHLIYSRVK